MNAHIEKTWEYKGFTCMVVIHQMGHRCGYVCIPKEHKYYKKHFDSIPVMCHGGLTYGDHILSQDDFWIGFDCAHYGDAYDFSAACNAYRDNTDVLEQLSMMAHITNKFGGNEGHIWTKDEVARECEKIVNQIIRGGK